VNLQEKLAALEDIMELDKGALAPETRLNSLDEWDSLAALSLVILLMEEFQRKISGKQIRGFATVQDILEVMQPES
jgi:acyl carrier protein